MTAPNMRQWPGASERGALDALRMLTAEQKKQTLLAPCIPLRFLLQPETREPLRHQMKEVSDSARFHRLHDLFWTMRDVEVVALLSEDEQRVLASFTRIFQSLP